MEKQDKSANRHHSPQAGKSGDKMDMSNKMENQDNSDVRRHFFDGDFPDIWYDMPFPHETDESGQILGLALLGETDIRSGSVMWDKPQDFLDDWYETLKHGESDGSFINRILDESDNEE